MNLKGKKVLLMGLGILGGGVATAKFLAKQGVDLTVTDMKSEDYLQSSTGALKAFPQIKFVLGRHEEKDFLENETIVINPDVPYNNKFVELARKNGKQIENELTLFYKFCPTKNIVAITGTRGKTTTATWIDHLLRSHFLNVVLVGNSPERPFLQEINKVHENSIVVMEVPSYHLEIVDKDNFRAKVAIITNIYQDHLARHHSMEEYVMVKSNIFAGQQFGDHLILNEENKWTDFICRRHTGSTLGEEVKSNIHFVNPNLAWLDKEYVHKFIGEWGRHNLENLLASILAAELMGVPRDKIMTGLTSLPGVKFRQEKVFENNRIKIYNDTAATSPEAATAAMRRFPNAVFISGGTDKELDFTNWAIEVKKTLTPEKLVLLSGSASEKMKEALGWDWVAEFGTLSEVLDHAIKTAEALGCEVVFSPGAKSFEKFKNEFDRGEQFNLLVKELLQ